jgi:hypothetical protein
VSYNPDQPRDPAGTSTGGQWTDDKTINAAREAAGLTKYQNMNLPGFKTLEEYIAPENLVDDKYVFYHATIEKNLEGIKTNGLKPTMQSSRWYMTTSIFSEAMDEHARGENPVVIEYRIPIAKVGDYLWGASERNYNKAVWHAPRNPIPGKYITKITRKQT